MSSSVGSDVKRESRGGVHDELYPNYRRSAKRPARHYGVRGLEPSPAAGDLRGWSSILTEWPNVH